MTIDIYCDSADPQQLREMLATGLVKGYTTNPSLLKKAGVTDYEAYARKMLEEFPEVPVSFELISNDFDKMLQEARLIHSWGKHITVKVPIVTTEGQSTEQLIRTLSQEGIPLNITLIFTRQQIEAAAQAVAEDVPSILSVFAGRIADTGVDPIPLMAYAKQCLANKPKAALLWASTREVLNIFQAQDCGCEIITVPTSVLSQLALIGKDLHQYSIEGAQAFERDAAASGLCLLPAHV